MITGLSCTESYRLTSSFLAEEIFIEPLNFNSATDPHANTKFDHEFGKACAVDQDDALLKAASIFDGMRTEG